MAKAFVILSLKHSEGKTPCFWRPDNAGYTNFPWAAGIYTEEQVNGDPEYYNDGYNTLAIPLTNDGMESIGFKCVMDLEKVKLLTGKTLRERSRKDKSSPSINQ